MYSLYTAIIACFSNLILTPLIIWIAHKKKWFDPIDERKIHKGSIPRLGGIGIFWTSYLPILGFTLFSILGPNSKPEWGLLPAIIGMFIVHFLSLVDDFRGLSARFRFVVQVIVALVLCYFNVCFHSIWLPGIGVWTLPVWVSWGLTALWVVGVINAMNMIDGMDGLCGGICIIASCTYGIIFLLQGEALPALYALALVGALAGFLFYNFPPAKIFMGDSGSTYLGFMMAILPLLTGRTENFDIQLFMGATVILVPVFDTFAAMWRRAKAGMPLMSPDKGHLHHKLLGMGLGRRTILSVIYTVSMGLGAVAIASIYLNRLTFFILIIATWLVVLGLFFALHYFKERGIRINPAQD
jgi:UDP-GlcNAc:undecaprenyl-phosphate/decaprenyl-phosphate GlcNAc-1-phosphate transferase